MGMIIERAADPTIIVGDVVRLRSGGPNMTVHKISGESFKSAVCVYWCENAGEYHQRDFMLLNLKRIATDA